MDQEWRPKLTRDGSFSPEPRPSLHALYRELTLALQQLATYKSALRRRLNVVGQRVLLWGHRRTHIMRGHGLGEERRERELRNCREKKRHRERKTEEEGTLGRARRGVSRLFGGRRLRS